MARAICNIPSSYRLDSTFVLGFGVTLVLFLIYFFMEYLEPLLF